MLKKSRYYFGSLLGFMLFLSGLNRRIKEFFYKYCSRIVIKRIERAFKKIVNSGDMCILNLISDDRIEENLSKIKTDSIVNEADKYLGDYINILGSGWINIYPVNWHMDFKTGYIWQQGTFFRDYDQETLEVNCDVKVPRELSRFHHLLKVALAYKLTQNEKYASYCIEQINHWIDENPLMFSINWGCTMDVAIRAVNWIWILNFLTNSSLLTDEKKYKILKSLYEHGWYIYRNPEKGIYNNHNHYLGDLAGQIYLGLLFNRAGECERWLSEGMNELYREIRYQILPCGISYEKSTNYNRLVLELIVIPVLALKHNGFEVPFDIWFRLECMFNFIKHSLKPNGTSSVIGDQDNGRLLPFGTEDLLDFRYLLSLGAVLFQRSDFKQFGDGYNIYSALLSPPDSWEIYDKLEASSFELGSIGFKDAGYYIMRKKDNFLIFNVTGKGQYPELPGGTHTHSDLLSFELVVNGKTILIDPGSYVYTADVEQRMLFRSTAMHNTVTVDDLSQNVIKKECPWEFERNAIPEVIQWETNDNYDLVVAMHNGYARLKNPVYHQRSIVFDKINESWSITDKLTGHGNHNLKWHFHFDASIDFSIKNNRVEINSGDGNNITLSISSRDGDKLNLRKESNFVSKSYGAKEPTLTLVVEITAVLPYELSLSIEKV